MDTIKIEKLKKEHLDAIMEIESACYGEHHWSKDSFESEIESQISHYFCVLVNDVVAGYMGFWEIIDEAHITTLAIHPDFRHRKLAKILILNALDFCYNKKIKYLTLEVRVSNDDAIKLYETFGFSSLGVRKKYYQNNNEDALIMWTKDIFSSNYKEIYNCLKDDIKDVGVQYV